MKTDLYTITTLTNMHVGSGEINFDIIDKQVQRDTINKLPIIHSSSLKGAFRENFKIQSNMVEYIFGPSNSENSHQTGAFSFLEASLLTRPVRSSVKSYFNATSPSVINALLEMIEHFGISFKEETKVALEALSALKPQVEKPLIFENIEGAILEDYEATYHKDFDVSVLEKFLGSDLALFNDDDFKALELPILARNHLENGVSQNLWYEEVVPKGSKFFFAILKPDNLDEQDKKDKLEKFENGFENNIRMVQFGANKSIGYGFSQVKKVSL
jgi:CRISPR-associated protein Cmr4